MKAEKAIRNLVMKEFELVESFVQEDYMPIDYVFDQFIQDKKSFRPNSQEFSNGLSYLKKVLNSDRFVCLIGPEMTKINENAKKIGELIYDDYLQNGFEGVHYKYWIDLAEHH